MAIARTAGCSMRLWQWQRARDAWICVAPNPNAQNVSDAARSPVSVKSQRNNVMHVSGLRL